MKMLNFFKRLIKDYRVVFLRVFDAGCVFLYLIYSLDVFL